MTAAAQRSWVRRIALAGAACLALTPAIASETITYGYDALGRLVKVARSGTVNNGTSACYVYDKADNRANVTVQTTSDCAAGSGVSFSISSNGAVTEGINSAFTVTKTGTASGTLTVNYATSNGTAVQPSDYTTTAGTLTFLTTDTTQTINVPTVNDSTSESTETFAMTLSAPSGGATLGTASANGTINDDDAPPACNGVSFTIASNAAVTEGANSVFTVTKSGTATGSCNVNYATSNGTAVAPGDYTAAAATLTFLTNETSKTINVPTIDDGNWEPAETVAVTLSAPSGGATLDTASAAATINDNGAFTLFAGQNMWSSDGRFALWMQTDGNLVLYGPDGPMWMTGTNGGSDRRMVMQSDGNLVVYNGANQALWYSGTGGNPGSHLALQNDGNLVIYNSSGVPIWATSTGYQPPSFSINDTAVSEGGLLTFTVTRSKATTATYSVNFASADGTAAAGSDYVAANGTLTFAPADTSRTISISTTDDTAYESAETLYVSLSGASGGSIIGRSQGIGTINDNDPPPNQAPVANFDNGGSVGCGSTIDVNVVANDTDPEGNYPLSVVSASGASVVSTTSVRVTSIRAGAKGFTYVVRDSLNAQTTGSGSITFTAPCP